MTPVNSNHRRQKRQSLASTATQIVSGAVATAGLLIASQALYLALCTPRLPPPDNSGHDFDKDGLLVPYIDKDGQDSSYEDSAPEFRLVLLGDSPVEGIGNATHCAALGGQTALAFSKLLKRPVRYWSYGKSGLTAKGIQLEMVPLLQRVSQEYIIDAIVVSCGVNNVLIGQAATQFGKEVHELLDSTLSSCCSTTRIIVMELLDFALMPFIPFPLSQIASWRSRALQREMEAIVNEHKDKKEKKGLIGMAYMPQIEKLMGQRNHHPLLDHLTQEQKDCLQLTDFFADDDFHPANLGTTIIGKMLATTYSQLLEM